MGHRGVVGVKSTRLRGEASLRNAYVIGAARTQKMVECIGDLLCCVPLAGRLLEGTSKVGARSAPVYRAEEDPAKIGRTGKAKGGNVTPGAVNGDGDRTTSGDNSVGGASRKQVASVDI